MSKNKMMLIIMAAYFAGLAGTMVQFSVLPVLPSLQTHFQIGNSKAGLLMSIFAITTLCTALPAGWLVNRYQARLVGFWGLLMLLIGTSMILIVYPINNFILLLISRSITGLGFGLISVAAPSAIGEFVAAPALPIAMGIWATWIPAGSVLMFILAPRLMSNMSIEPLILLLLAFTLVAIVTFLLFIPSSSGMGHRKHQEPITESERSGSKRILWVGIAFACYTFSFFSFNTWLTTFLTDHFHLTLFNASLIGALVSFGNAIFNILSGWILFRCGARWWLAVLPGVLISFSWPCFLFHSWPMIIIASLTIGIAGGAIPTIVFAAPGSLSNSPRELARAMSIVIFGENAGIVLGPLLFGIMVDWTHGFASSFLVLLFVSMAMCFAMWRTSKAMSSSGSRNSVRNHEQINQSM